MAPIVRAKKRKLGGTGGREEKRGEGGREGRMCPLCSRARRGPPTSGCGNSVAASCFFFCLFLFTHLTRLGHIFSWHHVPSYLFTRRMKLQQSCLKHENNGGSGRQRCHLRLNYHNKSIKMQVLVLFLCQLKHLEGEHDQNYNYRKHAKKKVLWLLMLGKYCKL